MPNHENHEKYYPKSAVLMMLGIMISVLVVPFLSNDAFAQPTLHARTLYETVNQTAGLNEIAQIDVGSSPSVIMVYDNIYVLNSDSNTVSVISTENHTKTRDIPVGEDPEAIASSVGEEDNLYVVNEDSNTVSVISANNNTKIGEDIPVGEAPVAVAVDSFFDTVYIYSQRGF